jgi:C_GCAxxG_C_C family probable redox protein
MLDKAMSEWCNRKNPQAEALIAQIKKRAENLYLTRQLLCAEAVLVTINKGLDGGLSDSQAVAMAAPFCMALGESGCVCGALSGAILACGLLGAKGQPYHHRRSMRESARQLHDVFKSANGATCCRALTRNVQHDRNAHFQQCANLTAEATEMAARLILYKRPELIISADNGFLHRSDTNIGGAMAWLLRLFYLKK